MIKYFSNDVSSFLGLSNRLKAFEKFLELHPGYIEKIMLLQVAVPSRTDVQEYIGKIDIEYFGIEIQLYYNKNSFVSPSVQFAHFQISRMKWISSLAKSTEDFPLHVGRQSDIFLAVSIR